MPDKVSEKLVTYSGPTRDPEFQKRLDAMRPLFEPHEEPSKHRSRSSENGESTVTNRRRPSPLPIVNNLRNDMRAWRNSSYAGVSDTTFELMVHWFHNEHRMQTPDGEISFNYYWCQREAVETFIYLREVRGIASLTDLIGEFDRGDEDTRLAAALGIEPSENRWPRYAMKLATGAGKTKLMSLLIAYSYFHRLKVPDSPMAKDFVIIAPGLTVYERLKDDFADGKIFHTDPLIPPAWRSQWNMDVVLQDEAGGVSSGGTIYLTNIHQLYPKRNARANEEAPSWAGPTVSKSTALDTSAELRERIAGHGDLMIFNDEAHHVWDPDSAWNEAIEALHAGGTEHGGRGLVAQIDLTATPRDNRGQTFRHVVCDTPLGEAVDAGIVKAPIIGIGKLGIEPSDNASERYDRHLRLGYERWLATFEEWKRGGKKALLFVMCEDTEAADQIAARLNSDDTFKELNGRTVNLHTNLKGKVKSVGRGKNKVLKFVEDDKKISDDDLRALRQLSRELDSSKNDYRCIVSVLMLREGWDVRNVTTIVPLRPLSAENEVLPEQTLGRGLRRMTPPGMSQPLETVTVIEHDKFQQMYREQLEQEGLITDPVDSDAISSTTVSIFPDHENKDVEALDISLPQVSAGHRTSRTIDPITRESVDAAANRYKPLPLGNKTKVEIDYVGRNLVTGQVIEQSKIELPLLKNPMGAITYFVRQIERACKVPSLHATLSPLVRDYITERLFGEKLDLFDPRLCKRLGDSDVAEYIRAVFLPLVRENTTEVQSREIATSPKMLSSWRSFQVTQNDRHPTVMSSRTLFNLVPCDRGFEVAFTEFLSGTATDIVAMAKNAGPQKLRVDYLSGGSRVAFYVPDFFVLGADGVRYLVETKGREDRDVPLKARAAIAWCEAASTDDEVWKYVFVPEGVFERFEGDSIVELAAACEPSLANMLEDADEDSGQTGRDMPLFRFTREQQAESDAETLDVSDVIEPATMKRLSSGGKDAVIQAVAMLGFLRDKPSANLASVLHPLLSPLDAVCRNVIENRLTPAMPKTEVKTNEWFAVDLHDLRGGKKKHYERVLQNLERTVRQGAGTMPIGLLRDLMNLSLNERKLRFSGVLKEAQNSFSFSGGRKMLKEVEHVYGFRNEHVAHAEEALCEVQTVEQELVRWSKLLASLTEVATEALATNG
ncbi:DEAD/DEAH box helicase [Rhodopirellula europaea]|uniref:DEAD/DEAH box helicase n=1 Tax=Rhodopirellula europaea TaxID=1263866 RepID=UPI003D2C662D